MRFVYGHRILFTIAMFALVGSLAFLEKPTEASNPTNGALDAVDGTMNAWDGTLTGAPPAGNGEASCDNINGQNCDLYTLTVNPGAWSDKQIRIQFTWLTPASDYDMTVRREDGVNPGFQGDGIGAGGPETGPFDPLVGSSGNGTNTFEEVVLSPPDAGAVYYIRAVYFAGGGPSDQYHGTAAVESTAGGGGGPLPPSACTVPTFDNYAPPVGYPRRDGSGEPSIGSNWNTGNVLTMSRLRANRTVFDDSTSPADPVSGVSWTSVAIPNIVTGFDPILFTDQLTGRTIGGELVVAGGATDGAVTDDDFISQTANFTTGGAVQGFDHQTIGGGPPKVDATNPILVARQPITSYPHLFYYASQQIAYGSVSTSFDGGNTYGTAVTAYTTAECNGLHGHLRVAPDGTVYLPNKNCGGKAAVVVSEDNGLNWSIRPLPDSSSGDNDPSVGIGAGGRVYVSYTASNKHPRVAVSDDKGLTWRDDFDLGEGTTPNLTAAVFPAVVAGDNDRAMVFFLATDSTNPNDPTGTDGVDETGADPDLTDNFLGTWYPYVAYTCDGGQSWSVTKADNDPLNPGLKNPVQQGVVCTNGTTCPDDGTHDTRNLLDFNDFTVDSRGRGLAVYADGCNFDDGCISVPDHSVDRNGNQSTSRLTIIRQRGGMRLFSAFDPGGPTAPSLSPPVQVKDWNKGYQLSWATPDDGGSELLSYKIYRGEEFVAEVKASQNSFVDNRLGRRSRRNVSYTVTAVNKYGESPRNVQFSAQDGLNAGKFTSTTVDTKKSE